MGYNYNDEEVELYKEDGYIHGENYSMFYANSLDVRTSITDVMINFKQSTPNGFLDNTKIIMNPSLAKELFNALNKAIVQHENIHGEIKDIETLQKEMNDFYGPEE
ncbi:DUF3467 domain-containing protein [Staphylococcus hominis]|uniref:DUF3467 domain-containing protein n=1 Tax=Staphylococcus hominis TaxID=1290 RepID=UPI001F1B3147|nr:DUF3467 domain-containing protein [Staphylococcus hominis]MCE4990805.1 DUF3467 domain-containing protein [Staphylococcus hominis]